ncbi:extradiol ring-cleavage dioxygenase domain-containing protein (plasmid) [Rhizobium phaseoli]|uniref:Extradiol ring-cleavage dioxygenase domain-containing protein n=1 Tax=Rhizobium phaseoli TaxID=396 RepID=A0ABM6CGZ7_9HYPH|nr:extradiol ring-cleavage dioxygenase domain-containing protein [Rhizobium phaseoli]ANL94058.1 extradiol ring-cleavage dioxygenase domain-containing protein [Rhizobium phaseoli]
MRDEGVLIIGSGLSYHNLSAMRGTGGYEPSRRFDAWLQETLVHTACDKRAERLLDWQQAPAARAAHPREDHLIPLMVVVGAAENEAGATTYHQKDFAGGLTASSFRFGRVPAAAPANGDLQ